MHELTTIRKACICLVLCVLLGLSSSVLHASERHALIIGNSDYSGKKLNNPRNDARDMATQLKSLGYQIYRDAPVLDLDRIGIERTIRAFAHSLPGDAQVLFYYAGHGISTLEDNYLIPIKHNLQFLEQLPDRAIGLRSMVDLLKNANPDGMNVFLLDACRDSPLDSSYRGIRRGLQKLNDIPRGVFIGYAADSGQVAQDGAGRNGTYTSELLQIMKEMPDVIIEIAHKEVASRVFDKTRGAQFPVSENKVYGDWCFGACSDELTLGSTINSQTGIEASESMPVVQSKRRNWKVIGGVALGALAIGLALNNDDDDTDETNSGFQIFVEPP